MHSSSTFLGFLGSTAYFRFVRLKLIVNLKLHQIEKVQVLLAEKEPQPGHVHLWPSHVQLVEDVFLDAGGGRGCQSHHWHVGELLTQLMQLLVVWTKIVTPLKTFKVS